MRKSFLFSTLLVALLSLALVGCGDDVPSDDTRLADLSEDELQAACEDIGPVSALECPEMDGTTLSREASTVEACNMAYGAVPSGCQLTVGDLRVVADDDRFCSEEGEAALGKAFTCLAGGE